MKTKKYTVVLVTMLAVMLVAGCRKDDLTPNDSLYNAIESSGESTVTLMLPDSDDIAGISREARNVITQEKILLGQLMFHDPGFGVDSKRPSGKGTYSCATCHIAKADFRAGIAQGIGDGGQAFGFAGDARIKSINYTVALIDVQPRATSSALNLAFSETILADGRLGAFGANAGTAALWNGGPQQNNAFGYQGLETQAIAGIDVHRIEVNRGLVEQLGYKALFDAAFPFVDEGTRYSKLNAALAIAAYERTLLTNEAPFQRWLRGDNNAMSDAEKRGGAIFFGKAGCVNCHSGPALSDNDFHALGTKDLFEHLTETVHIPSGIAEVDLGRGGFTRNPEDFYKFRTTGLYNVGTFQFHGAMTSSIRDAVEYFNAGIPAKPTVPGEQISPLFKPLGLTEDEVDDLISFIDISLRDNNLERYLPLELPNGGCFPNADPPSRTQLGCD